MILNQKPYFSLDIGHTKYRLYIYGYNFRNSLLHYDFGSEFLMNIVVS